MSTKRVNYFSGQFLRQEDFTEEQNYLRAMRHRHNSEVHTYGVVEGLEVTATGISGEIEIENGWAIDLEGKEIILASVDPVRRTVSGAAPWYITCRYEETLSDEQPESVTGINGYRRIVESANIEVVSSLPTDVLVLAEITGTLASLIIADRRHFSGMNLPGDLVVQGDLEVQGNTTIVENEQMQGNVTLGDEDSDTVTVEGTMSTGHSSGNLEITSPVNVTGGLNVSGAAQLASSAAIAGTLDVSGTTQVGGDLSVTGNLQVQGNTTIVSNEQMQGNVTLGDEDSDTVTVEGTMVTGHSSGNLEITSPVNVTGGLNISGAAQLASSAAIDGSLDVSGRTQLADNTSIAGTLDVSGTTQVGGDLSVTGNLQVQGNTTIVSNEQMQGNVTLGDEDSDTVTVEGTMVTGHSSGNLEITSPVNVTGGLRVSGAAQLVNSAAIDGSLDVSGPTRVGDELLVQGVLEVGGPTLLNGGVSVGGVNLDNHLAFNSSNPGNPHGITPEMIGAMPATASANDIGEGQFVSVIFSQSSANGAQRTVTLGFKPKLLWTTATMQTLFTTSGGNQYLGFNSSGFADLRGTSFQQRGSYTLFEVVPYIPYTIQRTGTSSSHLCYGYFKDSRISTSIKEMAFGISVTSVVASGSNWDITFTFRRSPPSTTQYNTSPFTTFSTSMQVWCLGS